MTVFLSITGVLCTISGLWFTGKTLQSLTSPKVVFTTLVVLFLGTNLFQLTVSQNHPVHSFLFGLFALFLWLNQQWHQSPKWSYVLLMICSLGLIGFLHHAALVFAVIPALWGVHDLPSFNEKRKLIKSTMLQSFAYLVFLILFIVLCGFPWFTTTGYELYFGPGNKENYMPIAPYLRVFLFSFKRGWIIYTPIVVFIIAGFYFLAERNRPIFFAVFFSFFFYLLTAASWPNWWYGDSFGQRSMIETYAILALPLGYLISWLMEKRRVIKIPAFVIIAMLTLLNLFQTWQFQQSILNSNRLTAQYYSAVFGQTQVADSARQYLEPLPMSINDVFPGEAAMTLKKKINLGFEYAMDYYEPFRVADFSRTGKYSIRMNSELLYSPGMNAKFIELTEKNQMFLRITGYIYFTCPNNESKVSLVATCHHQETNYKYRSLHSEMIEHHSGKWTRFVLDYETPPMTDKNDAVLVYFWFRGGREVYLDDLEILCYEPDK